MKLALALFATSLLASTAAAAPGSKQKAADKKFVEAQTAYQEGKFQAAIALFKEAYDLVRDPVYLFNIAQSYRKVADCVAAHEYYVKYLDAAPSAENKDKVRQWIVELKPCVDKAREREAEAARANEEAERQRREAEEANRQRFMPAAPVETEVDRGGPFRVTGIALAGIGALGIIAGAVFSVQGNGIQADLDDMCSPPSTCLWDSPEIQSLHQDGETANSRAFIGYVGGGIALAAGIALYMVGRSRVETVIVTPNSGGATVGASLRF
jgi:tetratricopeptide (TPR) repeat protein